MYNILMNTLMNIHKFVVRLMYIHGLISVSGISHPPVMNVVISRRIYMYDIVINMLLNIHELGSQLYVFMHCG